MADDVILLEPGDERAQKIAKAMASPTAGDILQTLKDGPKTSGDLTDLLHLPMSTVKYHIQNLLDAGVIEISETRYSVKGREVKVYTLKDQLVIVAPRTTSVRSLLLKYASIFGVFLLATLVVVAMTPLVSFAPVTPADRGESWFNASPGQQAVFSSVPPSPLAGGSAEGAAKATGASTGESGTGVSTLVPTAPLTVIPASTALVTPSPITAGEDTFPEDTPRLNGVDTGKITTGGPATTPIPAPVPFTTSPALIFFTGGLVVLVVVIGYDLVMRNRKKE
jgi:DNA-binding transcriptional ArsR family regulator